MFMCIMFWCMSLFSTRCICILSLVVFFFKQKTADEMRISYWSSDVCSSDLPVFRIRSLDRKTHRVACATRRRTRRLPRAGAQARQARPPADQGPRRHRRDVGARLAREAWFAGFLDWAQRMCVSLRETRREYVPVGLSSASKIGRAHV